MPEPSKPNGLERRSVHFDVAPLRLQKREGGKPPKIVGYAATFNRLSGDLGGFREKIAPGAFREVIKTADCRALINHDANLILGRTKSGTLALREDATGLYVEISPPETDLSRHYIGAIERGDISGQSFAFIVGSGNDQWEKAPDGTVIRTINRIQDLYDIGPVVYPAYESTTVSARSLASLAAFKETGKPAPAPGRLSSDDASFPDARLLGGLFRSIGQSGHVPSWVPDDLIDGPAARSILEVLEEDAANGLKGRETHRGVRLILDQQAKRGGSRPPSRDACLLRLRLMELGI